MNQPDYQCARDGCEFVAELVLIAGCALPTTYCGDGCRDYAWLARGLAGSPLSPEVAESIATLAALGRLLDGRRHPAEIGALLGGE